MDEPFWDSKIYWKNLALPVALCCYWANRRVLVKSNPNHHILIWTWQVKNRSLQLSSQAIWLNHTLCAVLQKPDRLIQYISTTSQQQEASLIVLKHSLGWNQKDLRQRIDSDADYGGIRARMKTSLFGLQYVLGVPVYQDYPIDQQYLTTGFTKRRLAAYFSSNTA